MGLSADNVYLPSVKVKVKVEARSSRTEASLEVNKNSE
jgi:hypothetical protein